MAVAILVPNGTLSTGGVTIGGGAASVHAALSDSSDATYVDFNTRNSLGPYLQFGTFTLPAGAKVTAVTIKVRSASTSGTVQDVWVQSYSSGGNVGSSKYYINNTTTISDKSYSANASAYATQTNINDATVLFGVGNPDSYVARNVRVYRVELQVYYNEKPVVSNVAITANTTKPTVTWTYTDPDNDTQRGFVVKVFSSAQYSVTGFNPETYAPSNTTWDSGFIYNPQATYTPTTWNSPGWQPPPLVPGTTYRFYVRAEDGGGRSRSSDWTFLQTTITIEPPGTATGTAYWDTAHGGRVRLTLQGHANLLTLNQSSIETDTTGWVAGTNASIARSTAQASHGGASLAVTAISAGSIGARTPIGTAGIPIAADTWYVGSFRVRAAATARSILVRLLWYTAAGAALGETTYAATDSTTAWSTDHILVAKSPATAAFAALGIGSAVGADWAANEVHYLDQAMVVPGDRRDIPWSIGGYEPTTTLGFQRSTDNGVTWREVWYSPLDRTKTDYTATKQLVTKFGWKPGTATTSAADADLADYEIPPGSTARYRAYVAATNVDGFQVVGPYSDIFGSDQITSGSFESPAPGATATPTNWVRRTSTGAASYRGTANDQFLLGAQSFKVTRTAAADSEGLLSIPIPCKPGDVVELTAWVRSDQVLTAGIYVGTTWRTDNVQSEAGAGFIGSTGGLSNVGIGAANTWTLLRTTATAPANANYVMMRIISHSTGNPASYPHSVWFDSVTLRNRAVAADYKDWWIKDVNDSGYNAKCDVMNPEWVTTSHEDQAVYHPLGRDRDVVISDVVRGESFDLDLEFPTKADQDNFETMRKRQRTLLLQSIFTNEQWHIRLGADRVRSLTNTEPKLYRARVSAIEVDPPDAADDLVT